MRLGVITDGISQDPQVACRELARHGIEYAELQYVFGKEVGEHSADEVAAIKRALSEHGIKVACITRHNFNGIPWDTPLDDELIVRHRAGLERSFALAAELASPLVRVMSCRKEMILFGDQGAENWVVRNGAWQAQVRIMEVAVRLAERAEIDLVTETENGGMITSNFLAAKLIEELDSPRLGILWDPTNSLYCTEEPLPTGYECGRRHIRHIHIKDAQIDIPRATVQFRALGTGDLAPYLVDIAAALRRDRYDGVVSLEANYHPPGGAPGSRPRWTTFGGSSPGNATAPCLPQIRR